MFPARMCLMMEVRFVFQCCMCHKVIVDLFSGLCWTLFVNRDKPSGTGDWETLSSLLRDRYDVCSKPRDIDCQTATGLSFFTAYLRNQLSTSTVSCT